MTRVYFFKLSYYYLSIVILSMCSFFRVSRNAFLRPESVCKVTALFCLCQKVRQCLTLFNLSAPRLTCRRRHFRKASAKVRPFSSTAKFFRTFFRGFFVKIGPRTPKTLSFHNIAQLIFFMGITGAMGIMRIMRIMRTMGIMGVLWGLGAAQAVSKAHCRAKPGHNCTGYIYNCIGYIIM